MSRFRELITVVLMAGCSSFLCFRPAHADYSHSSSEQDPVAQPAPAPPADSRPEPETQAGAPAAGQSADQGTASGTLGHLVVTVGKSLIIDSPLDIRRLSVANGDLAEAVAINPREVLINGKAAGETSLIVWQQNGARLAYDLTVRMSSSKLEAVRQQIARDFPNEDISVTFENDTAFVRGTVKDLVASERVIAMAATLGKTVNLMRVEIPGVEPQVLLKVKFANVDRSVTSDLGLNLWNGSFNQQTSLGTGPALYPDETGRFPVNQIVNILLLRPDLNLVAQIQALQAKRALELLAEPNLLTISGEQASFLAGGEFPFPMVQPGQGNSAISIMWREYGVRLSFLPTVTPRGTIRLKVSPEVSSLDFTNAVSVLGVTVPGLSSRRVQTEVELESGQSFVIAGLLDKQTSEILSKVPGISAIPVLGKLFQSKSANRNNSELMVIITPELVRPIPAGQPTPNVKFTTPFMSENQSPSPSHPGMDKTGPVPLRAPAGSIPVEQLMNKQSAPPPPNPMFQLVPVAPSQAPAAPANTSSGGATGGPAK